MLYLALFRKGFQRMMAYRSATLAGIATNFFFGLLRTYLFIAVFDASGQVSIGGFSLRDAITFTALTQAFGSSLGIINWWWEVGKTIESGEIITDLTKPFHYFSFWLSRDLGRMVFQVIFRGLPIMIVYPFFFELTWPTSMAQWLLFSLSLSMAMIISFCWHFWMNCLSFWFVNAKGFGRFAWLAAAFFSGFLIPLSFFPDWLKAIAMWTPLPAIINTPIEIYLGVAQGAALWEALGLQLFWVIAFTIICELTFRAGRKRLVIQGG